MALPFDDDSGEGFWGGNQLCGVSYALAVAATSIILSFPQQGLASQLVTDEDFWPQAQLPPPVQATLYQKLPIGDPEEIPAHTLKGQLDEDFWPQFQLPPPVRATLYQKLPLGDPEEIPAKTLRGLPEEELWQNRVWPVPATIWQELPYLPDPEEIPAGKLHGLT